MAAESRAIAWGELAEGAADGVDFVVSAEELQQFAALSCDCNPLHVDADFARSKGFDDVVVHGALLVAKISQLIGMRLPGRDSVWTGLTLQFRHPLYVGQAARVEAVVERLSAATGMVLLKLTLRAGETLLAKGEAEVLLVRP
ncbi:MaoC/PaaZ C-terminal domain-containing protein [Dechloromonas sp. A34]|uniref:MaoC/PaaZ C-terminal domain-containing protein n=1 Tax=Dechloromonas sp. A34 TaxID=447588 RepID=UPI002248B64D|nr:MaoC/PaaZ C-terminal domain-containing protein [Dechloromonas sp. A34]